jgi:quercetin dioxygenase-like cupin family protein
MNPQTIKIEHYTNTPAQAVEDVPGVTVRWVIGQEDGAPNFAMRVFEVEPGHATPYHQHPWEHEVFILHGEGAVRRQDNSVPVSAGTVVYVPGMEMHQFLNRGTDILSFICVVPIEG